MSDLEEYLEFVYGTDKGYVYVPTLSVTGEWDQRFFLWPDNKVPLTDYIRTAAKEQNVHIGTCLYTNKDATRKGVSHSNVVWVEFDGNYTGNFKDLPKPSLEIRSSTEHKVHCYWKTDRLEPGPLEEITRRLAYYLEADTSAWNANRVLRPPETFNYKYGKPLPVSVISKTEGVVSSKVFDRAPILRVKPLIASEIEIKPFRGTLGKYPVPEELRQIILNTIPKGDRSGFLYKIAADLGDLGATEVDIISILYHVDERVKKFSTRSDRLERYASIAVGVALKRLATNSSRVYSIDEILKVSPMDENWILPDLIAPGDVSILFGLSSIGKSQIALDWSLRFSAGLPILDREIKPTEVMFVSLEMNEAGIQFVTSKQVQAYKDQDLSKFKVAFLQTASHEELKMDIEIYRPQLVIIDSIFAMSIDELDQKEAIRIFYPLLAMAKEFGTAFLMIHHITKIGADRKDGPTLTDMFGASRINAIPASVIAMWEPSEGDIELKFVKTRWTVKERHSAKRNVETLTFDTEKKGTKNVSGKSRSASPGTADIGLT